jgi:DUF1680 family protein
MEKSMGSTSDITDLGRREFVQIGASLAALISCGKVWSAPTQPDRVFEHGNPLHEIGYGDVVFAPGLHQAQLDQTHAVLVNMNEDSLLRPFRLAAQLPAPGSDLGGWYSDFEFGPETFGQWISALSRYYAVTRDEASRDKVRRLISGFSQCLEPSGKIFTIRQDKKVAYGYDKLVCGLVDALKFGEIPEALDTLEKATTAATRHLPGKAIDYFAAEQGAGESYTIPENQFIAWQRGGEFRHLEMAKEYLYNAFFDDLANGRNVLARRHAYSHVNALSSAAKAYLVLGDEKYLKAASNGLAFVEQQSFATGGWGPSEAFLPRPAEDHVDPNTGEKKHYPAIETLADSIANESNHFETPCGSYAHFKLTRYLLRITKNPHYGDSMERIMYNTVLGALALNKYGKAFYQSNYHSHAHKAYFDGYGHLINDEWPCCSGTLPQIAADYRISTYFKDEDGLFLNLYIPSTIRWEQHGAQMSLTQTGQYPLSDSISIKITASTPTHSVIRLRIPAWTEAPSIRVNGKWIPEAVQSGTFASISREWKTGDHIELNLPRSLELKPVDTQHPDVVTLVSGPVVLFAISDDTPKVTRVQLLAAKQQSQGSAEWHVDVDGGPLRLIPFWAIKDETYFTYLGV